jgi:4-diphosphocytidyl-2-C-methyl-D-erythritol kinase
MPTYSSFAKVNLYLYIESKRSDGYHNLNTLMTQIDLKDDIRINFDSNSLTIVCDHPDVPEDESNLAAKAVFLFNQTLKKDKDCKWPLIEIIKRIPPGGGLGGGSSNAATILNALNNYYNTPFSNQKLMEMGLELGADVPFFINGEPAIAQGVGEKLEKVSNLKPYHLVLCDPGVSANTAKVYKNIDFRLTSKQNYTMNTGLNVPLMGQGFDLTDKMHNDLEESACRLYPKIKETKEEMKLLLQRKVYMTGSGSSLFALFLNDENASKGFNLLAKHWAGSDKKVFLSSFK